MKHERVLDAEYRGPVCDALLSSEAAGPSVRHGFGAGTNKARTLALVLTVAVHAGALGILVMKWGNGELSAAPVATSIATFNVGAAPAEPVTVPEPPEPLVAEPDAAQPAIDMPDIVMPAVMKRPEASSEQTASAKPKPSERTAPVDTPPPPARSAPTGTKTPAKAEASAPAKASSDASNAYGQQVMRHLSRYRRPNAIGPGATKVRFTVSASGGLSSAAIARSSGSTRFDREALAMVRRAAPFPKPPPGVNRDFSVEIEGQ